MYKTDEERLMTYKELYKKLRRKRELMDATERTSLTPVQAQVGELECYVHEIVGAELVLGISPNERIAVMDEILGPDLKKEVIPFLKCCMFLTDSIPVVLTKG